MSYEAHSMIVFNSTIWKSSALFIAVYVVTIVVMGASRVSFTLVAMSS